MDSVYLNIIWRQELEPVILIKKEGRKKERGLIGFS